MQILELPGQKMKKLVKMLVRQVLMTLNAELKPRLILVALGDWGGGVGRGLGEAGPA